MNKKKSNNKINYQVKYGNILLIFTLFLFVILIYRAGVLSLSKKVDGIDLKSFSASHTIKHETILAKRGNILDVNGDVLAQNVYSYTLIAYLSPSRGEGYYVKDKEYTAQKLAEVLDMSEDRILFLLNSKNSKGEPLYQTEFGNAGKGLTELTKGKIVDLNLPGIDFIEDQKRYYPKGNFLSYTLGYARLDGEGKINGEMGIEALYNDELTGTDGYREYQKDLKGYKIANTPEVVKEAEDGKNIYLTIDSNVQFFVEQALEDAKNKYNFEELNIMVADAKTGKILGVGSSTSFDPNIRNISTYMDPNISIAFEPGSTMKTFTYMAALETGKYDGTKTFKSGTYQAKDGTVIGDSDRNGWGVLTFDEGFAKSSNVGIINVINSYLDRVTLRNYFLRLGFGSKTGIELSHETSGKIGELKAETELYNAGFGQGIMVTSVQNIKALTSIANDGILLEPYIVDRIEDSNGKIVYQNGRKEVERVCSKDTALKIRDLMEDVVTTGTGTNYYMEGYDVIAKTGTAQISREDGKGYYKGEFDYIRGFAGMFPKDDPQIIIYANLKRPKPNSATPLSNVVKSVITNISKYYNIYDETIANIGKNSYTLDNYYSKKVETVKNTLEKNGIETVIVGDGDNIINQYPSKNIIVTTGTKVFLITDSNNYYIPNFKGWSKKDVFTYLRLCNISYKATGDGYLVNQNIKDVVYDNKMELELEFAEKFNPDYIEEQKENEAEEKEDKK